MRLFPFLAGLGLIFLIPTLALATNYTLTTITLDANTHLPIQNVNISVYDWNTSACVGYGLTNSSGAIDLNIPSSYYQTFAEKPADYYPDYHMYWLTSAKTDTFYLTPKATGYWRVSVDPRDYLSNTSLSNAGVCFFIAANETVAYDYLYNISACGYTIGYGSANYLQANKNYYFSVWKDGYAVYVSPVFFLTSNLDYLVTLHTITGNKTLILSSPSTTASQSLPVKFKVLANGSDVSNYVYIDQTVAGSGMQNLTFFPTPQNPMIFYQYLRFCGNSPIFATMEDPFTHEVLVSNTIYITVVSPCEEPLPAVLPQNNTLPPALGGQSMITPFIPADSFPPEIAFLLIFFMPIFWITVVVIGFATVVERIAKTDGKAFVGASVLLLFIFAFAGGFPTGISIVFGIIGAGIVAFFVTRLVKER